LIVLINISTLDDSLTISLCIGYRPKNSVMQTQFKVARTNGAFQRSDFPSTVDIPMHAIQSRAKGLLYLIPTSNMTSTFSKLFSYGRWKISSTRESNKNDSGTLKLHDDL
jgi:hypothetical protein